jgi:hypothetical protein
MPANNRVERLSQSGCSEAITMPVAHVKKRMLAATLSLVLLEKCSEEPANLPGFSYLNANMTWFQLTAVNSCSA